MRAARVLHADVRSVADVVQWHVCRPEQRSEQLWPVRSVLRGRGRLRVGSLRVCAGLDSLPGRLRSRVDGPDELRWMWPSLRDGAELRRGCMCLHKWCGALRGIVRGHHDRREPLWLVLGSMFEWPKLHGRCLCLPGWAGDLRCGLHHGRHSDLLRELHEQLWPRRDVHVRGLQLHGGQYYIVRHAVLQSRERSESLWLLWRELWKWWCLHERRVLVSRECHAGQRGRWVVPLHRHAP